MKTKEEYIRFAEANKNRMAYRRHMDALFPNGWGVNDLADWLCRNKTGRGLAELDPQIADFTPEIRDLTPKIEPVIPEDPVEARMTQYRNIFSADTPNDEMMLRILCQSEITIENLNKQAETLIESKRLTSKDLQDVVMMITKLSSECRMIQRDLGIDKPSRGEGQDAGMKLMDYVQQAKKVLHRQGIPIACPTCFHSEQKIKNLYGFFVWHLEDKVEWALEFTCPRCKTKMVIRPELVPDLKTMFEWE